MGAVYKAWQTNLDRNVAIKILPKYLNDADPSFVERFKQEAKTMAKLSHPAIIPVFDAGETASGLLYFVMEYVEGTDVFQMLQEQGHLKTKHALLITSHVCDALQYAHKHSVVHRDIKPANIMVDTEGYVRVADFGLAKSLQASTGLTQVDVGVGTPDYSAPEALTVGLTADHRADLYSVGVVLYQMLTGVVPRGNFKVPSEGVAGVDSRFDAIVLRAMESDPEERYQNASDIRQGLDQILEAPVIEAGGQSSPAIPKRELSAPGGKKKQVGGKKSPLVPILAGVAALLVVAAGALFLMKGKGTKEADAKASETAPVKETLVLKEAPAAEAQPSAPTPPKDPLLALGQGGVSMTSIRANQAVLNASKAELSVAPPFPASDNVTINTAGDVPAPNSKAYAAKSTRLQAPKSTVQAGRDDKKPAEMFSPGQWVKVFTKVSDLPDDVRKSASGVKLEDGWIRITEKDHPLGVSLPCASGRNYAVRARMVRGAKAEEHKQILLRYSGHTFPCYSLGLWTATLDCCVNRNAQIQHLFQLNPPSFPKPGELYTMEFGVVGDRLVCRFNSELVRIVTDKTALKGQPKILGTEDFGDIEVVNLDGLSEVEALRILGVDEKGNDLRALAAKQEQEEKEQARQVDAISAIPELKQLHEQFLKLQIEKVTAPFEADLTKLNTNYLGGLDRAIEDEKKAGRLDGVIALEEEKKLIADKQPLPEDDEKTPANLKKLRAVFRAAIAKLETTKAGNLKALTDPLNVRLKQLESEMTQKNRVPDAKTVREYREKLVHAPEQSEPARPGPSKGLASTRRDPALAAATKEKPLVNSLGMKFVPVKGTEVLFCIHETRWKDYAEYAGKKDGVDPTWQAQTQSAFRLTEREDDHPVICVSWDDALAFCKWLSEREKRPYRLASDREWSTAVGLGRKEKWRHGDTPMSVSKDQVEFPWGSEWPPPKGSGNYSDETRKAKAPRSEARYIDGFDDSFPTTAPVMSFAANEFGLFDLGGNVAEWVDDWWDATRTSHILRGNCWTGYDRSQLLSSYRWLFPVSCPRTCQFGFRVVIEVGSGC